MPQYNNSYRRSARKSFFKAAVLTFAAVALIVIGYFTAGYLSGGL